MFLDFTHTIDNGISAYCIEEIPQIEQIANISEDKYEARSIKIFTHTGTHIDSPRHILSKGKYIDEYPIDKFIGKGCIIDVIGCGNKISKEILIRNYIKISNSDFVFIKTGWDKYWSNNSYLEKYPVLDIEAAKYLSRFNLKAVGIDCISIAGREDEVTLHRIFLERDILIIENLNFPQIKIENSIDIIIAPLKVRNSDGVPVRVIGIMK